MYFQTLQIRSSTKIKAGTIKIWIGNKTHDKQLLINPERLEKKALNTSHFYIDEQIDMTLASKDMNVWTIIQFNM